MYLTNFHIQRPPYTLSQKKSLESLKALHGVDELVDKVCCREDKIGSRGFVLPDYSTEDQRFYGENFPGFSERSRFYSAYVDKAFKAYYETESDPPNELIHVTCTGYQSPSSAQKIVVEKGWAEKTAVTHVYHMGCYGAMPAVRIASGFASLGQKRIDIVHTELCSLHLNYQIHTAEQLVAQSLFADGIIRYSLVKEASQPALRLSTSYEELIPNTEELMKWECEDWGLKMTLSKKIPFYISQAIKGFISRLEKRHGHPLKDAIYAVHPGGPKIIELIQKKLALKEAQLEASHKILHQYGNMSSATLPHLWEEILKNSNYPSGTCVVSLAFGPGLCIASNVMEVV